MAWAKRKAVKASPRAREGESSTVTLMHSVGLFVQLLAFMSFVHCRALKGVLRFMCEPRDWRHLWRGRGREVRSGRGSLATHVLRWCEPRSPFLSLSACPSPIPRTTLKSMGGLCSKSSTHTGGHTVLPLQTLGAAPGTKTSRSAPAPAPKAATTTANRLGTPGPASAPAGAPRPDARSAAAEAAERRQQEVRTLPLLVPRPHLRCHDRTDAHCACLIAPLPAPAHPAPSPITSTARPCP